LKLVLILKYALAYAPGDEFPKSVNLDDPSVTLVPADVLQLQ
jgi:DNA polymerase-3 subunit beta